MAKTRTLPEHRRVLRRQPGWIRYSVPGLDDVKAYFNGTQQQLEAHIADLLRRRNKVWTLRNSETKGAINPEKAQKREAQKLQKQETTYAN